MFTPADHVALSGVWSWIGTVVGQVLASDRGGMVDDDLAYVTPWGGDLGQVSAPDPGPARYPGPDCPARTRSGWHSAALRRNCGYAQTTDTSQSSARASWPWTGWWNTLVRAEPQHCAGRAGHHER